MRTKNTFGIHYVLRTNRGEKGKAAIYVRIVVVYFGESDHMIPWQTDHLICWRANVANAIEALTKVMI